MNNAVQRAINRGSFVIVQFPRANEVGQTKKGDEVQKNEPSPRMWAGNARCYPGVPCREELLPAQGRPKSCRNKGHFRVA